MGVVTSSEVEEMSQAREKEAKKFPFVAGARES